MPVKTLGISFKEAGKKGGWEQSGVIEARGSVSFTGFASTPQGTVPTGVAYRPENGAGVDFLISLDPDTGAARVCVEPEATGQKIRVHVNGGAASPEIGDPNGILAARVVESKVLPWLGPLLESGFSKALVARDARGRIVSVYRQGVRTSWELDGAEAGQVTVERGDPATPGGARMRISPGGLLGELRSEYDLVFATGCAVMRVRLKHGPGSESILEAWEAPVGDRNVPFKPFGTRPWLETEAGEIVSELKKARNEAEIIRSRAE
jgi:hypothetical protein